MRSLPQRFQCTSRPRLDAANSYADLVNVDSNEVPSLKRVEPGDPDNSYLVQKVEGTAAVGGRMPLGGDRLPDAEIDLIRQWISEGANEGARALLALFLLSPGHRRTLRARGDAVGASPC